MFWSFGFIVLLVLGFSLVSSLFRSVPQATRTLRHPNPCEHP